MCGWPGTVADVPALSADPTGRVETVTIRCGRCADRAEVAVAPALAIFSRMDGATWAARVVTGRRGTAQVERERSEFDLGYGHERLATAPVRSGARAVEVRCRRCRLQRRVNLAALRSLADGARARRADVAHLGPS